MVVLQNTAIHQIIARFCFRFHRIKSQLIRADQVCLITTAADSHSQQIAIHQGIGAVDFGTLKKALKGADLCALTQSVQLEIHNVHLSIIVGEFAQVIASRHMPGGEIHIIWQKIPEYFQFVIGPVAIIQVGGQEIFVLVFQYHAVPGNFSGGNATIKQHKFTVIQVNGAHAQIGCIGIFKNAYQQDIIHGLITPDLIQQQIMRGPVQFAVAALRIHTVQTAAPNIIVAAQIRRKHAVRRLCPEGQHLPQIHIQHQHPILFLHGQVQIAVCAAVGYHLIFAFQQHFPAHHIHVQIQHPDPGIGNREIHILIFSGQESRRPVIQHSHRGAFLGLAESQLINRVQRHLFPDKRFQGVFRHCFGYGSRHRRQSCLS